MYIAIAYYLLGSITVFLQHNLQFIHPWWKDRTLTAVLVFAIPAGLGYLKSWTYFVEATGSAWSARFTFFGLSYLVFPVLAYFFLGESPWSLKTLISVILSVAIILVQYKL